MHLICSYCGRYIKEKEPLEVLKKTHGICQDCLRPLMEKNKARSCDEALETLKSNEVEDRESAQKCQTRKGNQ